MAIGSECVNRLGERGHGEIGSDREEERELKMAVSTQNVQHSENSEICKFTSAGLTFPGSSFASWRLMLTRQIMPYLVAEWGSLR